MADAGPIFIRQTFKPIQIINPQTRSPVEGVSPVITPAKQLQPPYKRKAKAMRPPRSTEETAAIVMAMTTSSTSSASAPASAASSASPLIGGASGHTAAVSQNQQLDQRVHTTQGSQPTAPQWGQPQSPRWGQLQPSGSPTVGGWSLGVQHSSRPGQADMQRFPALGNGTMGHRPMNGIAFQTQIPQSASPHTSINGAQRYPHPTSSTPSNPSTRQFDSKPDVYARSFIPETWSAINHAPAQALFSKPMSDISFPSYISSFAGYSFLKPLSAPTPPVPPGNLPPLTPQSYAAYFAYLLSREQKAQDTEAKSYNLYLTGFVPIDYTSPFFSVAVPGLREDAPKVLLGDSVLVRQVRIDASGEPWGMRAWISPGGGRERGLPAPGFTGYEHRAVVWGVDRTGERLLVRVDGLVGEQWIFNVVFDVPVWRTFERWWRAVDDVGGLLEQCHQVGNGYSSDAGSEGLRDSAMDREWVRRMLFPEETDGVVQMGLPQGVFAGKWFDRRLNYEQMKSTDSVRRQDYGSIPFLISGPPGTGKTKTIVEIALQLTHNPSLLNTHILLCAPSDSAADILVRRLKEHLSIPQLLRLNAASRPIGEVPIDLIGHCYVDGESNLFLLPDFKQLMNYKIVVTTCRDADLLVQARVTNRDLVQLEKGILDALHSNGQNNLGSFLHWTALLVDEAAQAMEPDVAIPLSVVAPPAVGGIGDVLVVMAGDQNQLGPRTSSRETNLERSLFERLFDRPLYRDHPLARKRAKARDWNLSARAGPMIRPPFANLFRNYRSHPAILAVPSALFYHDTLIPEAADVDSMIDWTGWRGRCWPILFSSNLCDDEIEYEGGGWYNINEAKKACDYALSLVQSNLIEQRDICIMSPFSAQVKLLRQTIRREPYELGAVNIGPMEVFQGLESRFVIICTTRTRSRFLAEDRARGLGMINEARRFNVAVTRAKQGLLVIGNPWVLAQDPAWVAFMAFCRRHGLWEDESQGGDGSVWMPDGAADEEVEKGYSSLERGLVVKEEGGSGMDERIFAAADEDGMWMAGIAAEEAFGDEF
ncbi:MAG: hypothetical protein M1839_002187 [Geoglossum umbratile]|nr:MAG: hypothetical protein M1839_002187 [Geoglossum umbratile]